MALAHDCTAAAAHLFAGRGVDIGKLNLGQSELAPPLQTLADVGAAAGVVHATHKRHVDDVEGGGGGRARGRGRGRGQGRVPGCLQAWLARVQGPRPTPRRVPCRVQGLPRAPTPLGLRHAL